MFIYEKSLYLLNVELKGLEGRHYLKEKKKKNSEKSLTWNIYEHPLQTLLKTGKLHFNYFLNVLRLESIWKAVI